MFRLVRNTPFGIKNDVLSGIVVSLTSIAQILMLCAIAGIDFRYGILGFCCANLVSTIFGARPGMISGPVQLSMLAIFPLIAKYGINYLFITVMISGVLQAAFAFLRLGKYVRMMPRSVILGTITGLSIIIFLQFIKTVMIPNEHGVDAFMPMTLLVPVVVIFIVAALGLSFIPKIFKFLPAGFVVIGLVIGSYFLIGYETPSLAQYAKFRSAVPFKFVNFTQFPWVPINLETVRIIFPYIIALTFTGILQSLFVLSFTDDLTNTRGKTNRETLSLGISNILSGLVGGTPNTAMLTQTTVNLNMGGKERISSGVVTLLTGVMVFVYPISLNWIPIYLLFAINAVIMAETFVRASIFQFPRTKFWGVFVLILVAASTVLIGMFYGIVLGVILSSSIFAWENARRIRVRKRIDDTGVKYYELYGPLFFGSAPIFKQKVDVDSDPNEVVFDFLESKVIDYEGAKTLFNIIEKYNELDKKVKIKYISSDMKRLIHKEQIKVEIIDTESDPTYTILIDELS